MLATLLKKMSEPQTVSQELANTVASHLEIIKKALQIKSANNPKIAAGKILLDDLVVEVENVGDLVFELDLLVSDCRHFTNGISFILRETYLSPEERLEKMQRYCSVNHKKIGDKTKGD